MPEVPPELDVTRPHPARMYDYYLGGKNHFAADREAAAKVLQSTPHPGTFARENRAFLGRAVRYLAKEAGIRQFLDIGTGLPTTNNVHEVAQAVTPSAHVVYVDNDPMVLAHARALLTSSPEGRTGYIHADLRDPSSILADPVTRDVLDFGQPIALMLVAILHFVPDEDKPAEVIAPLLDALPSGSYLAASHATTEHNPVEGAAVERAYREAGIPVQLRDSGDFARLAFSGLELIPPGVVLASEWRRDGTGPRPLPSEVNCYGGIARKPLSRAPDDASSPEPYNFVSTWMTRKYRRTLTRPARTPPGCTTTTWAARTTSRPTVRQRIRRS
jgi:SAM-dependent methyltransferase